MQGASTWLAIATTALAAALLATAARADDPYEPDTSAPIVTISQAPKSELQTSRPRKRATFVFESDDPQAIFTCRVDDGAYEACTSPMTLYFTAGRGKGRRHTFLVRATDLAGNSSGTAVRSLRVARKRSRR